MKHKRKIALLSVAAVPAMVTAVPDVDVQAVSNITKVPTNAQTNSLTTVASTTTSSDTATTVPELTTMVTEKLEKYESTFTINYKGSTANLRSDVNQIFSDFDNANPFIKEATIARDYTYTGYVNNMTITFNIQYNTNEKTEENIKAEIKRINNSLNLQNMTDLQKIKAIHDYVVTHATFAKTTGSPAYALLTEKKGMSDAYALVTHYLLQEAGLTSHYVTGTYKDLPHAWTVVQYDGKWYHLDTALDEPSVHDAKIIDPKAISYQYFLRGTDGMNSHTANHPTGLNIAKETPDNFKAIQNVYNPIQSGDTLYYTKEDDTIAKLDLTPLPRIGIDVGKELKESVFTSPNSASVTVKAKSLVHHNGWLYFSNPDDRGYLYKVSTDNGDLTLVKKFYVHDLKIIDSSLQYTKADNTTDTVPLVVDDVAIETVINLINTIGDTNTPNIKDVVNAKIAYEKLTASQKTFIENIGILNNHIASVVPNSVEDIVLKIASLDETALNFTAQLEDIRLAYVAIPDADKSKVYNYNDFKAAQSKVAAQAMNASKVSTQITLGLVPSNPTYYADVEKVKLALDGLTPAQQALISDENKTKLKNAVAALHSDRLAVADIIYQISVLDVTKGNFKEAFTLINTAMSKLTPNQKSLVSNMASFTAAKTKFDQYTIEVQSLESSIQSITVNTTTAQLQALYARYIAYNAAQRAMLKSTTIDALYNAIATDFAKSNTVDVVVNTINALKAEDATFKANVKNARIAFNAFNVPANVGALTPEQKDKFTAAELRLKIAEELVKDIEAIQQAISQIPTSVPSPTTSADTFTVDYKDKVGVAKTGMDALKNKTQVGTDTIPDDLKMTNHVEKHLANITLFHTAQKNVTDGDAVKAKIAALTNTSTPADVAAVRASYNALTPIGKVLAGDIAKLTEAETANNQAAADRVIALIVAIDNTNVDTFISNLTAAEKAYGLLSPEQLALIPQVKKDELAKYKTEAATLTAVYNAIEAVLESNPATYSANAEAAQKAFDALNADQQRFITNSTKLATFKTNIDAAEPVIAEIDALPKDATEEAILAVEAKYIALTEFQKKLVSNYSKLESLVDKVNGKEQAEAVIKMIDKLDETKKTFALDVKKARDAYDALSEKQKGYVTNYADLLAAEKKVADLSGTSDIAQKMIAQIAAINNTSASFKKDVEAAKSAYEALPEDQQALVNNYNVLKEHLATYDKYAAEAKKLEEQINALSNTSPGYQSSLAALQRQYNAFNAAQKAFVSEAALKLLNAAQAGSDAIRTVTNMILALNPSKPTFHADVANARAAYDALIKNYQTYLPEHIEQALEAAEALVAKDKSAARKVVDAINALSSESIHKEIERARRVYNNLTAIQRTLVTNLQILVDFETGKRSYNYSGIPSGVDKEENKPTIEEPTLPNFAAVPGERTSMTKASKSNTYTAKIVVDETLGRDARFVLTTASNVTAIIPPTVAVVGEQTGTMAIEIKAESSRIDFKATLEGKPVTFATEVQLVVESVPAQSVVYRITKSGERTKASYTVDGDQYTISTTGSESFIIARASTSFTDIYDDGHREYIEALAERNIIQSTTNGRFYPYNNITRAEFASMVARALAVSPSETTNFNDIRGKAYEDDVQALYEIGIIKGVNATTFNPNGTLTRQQAALMVERMLDYVGVDAIASKSPQFTDAYQIAPNAKNAIALMQQLGIISGKANGTFDPNGKLTNSQLAKILYKALETADML